MLRRLARIFPIILVSGSVQAFTLVTYNVGEITDPNPKRIERLMDTVLSTRPDAILLQEVEAITLNAIKSRTSITRNYRVSYVPSRGGLPKGGLATLVLRQHNPDKAKHEELPSEMGRVILIVPVKYCGQTVQLANVHLESPDLLVWRTLHFRHLQVDRIHSMANTDDPWILAGDLNPVFEPRADHWFEAPWIDGWRHLYPEDPGLTWDPSHNQMAREQGGFILPGFRLDRIFMKSASIEVKDMRRIGVETQPPLSDHYGLQGEFSCSDPLRH